MVKEVGPSGWIGVDIPIGLPDEGSRDCELLARKKLGSPRCCSVFPVPPRRCRDVASREQGSRVWMEIDGKKMSCQTFAILPKIREVDKYLIKYPKGRDRVAEMHPEVSFYARNGDQAMQFNKKKPKGQKERRALIEHVWPGQLDRLRKSLRGENYALDDLHDAFAELWSFRRWVAGKAETLGDGAVDAKGLPMRMVV